MKKIFLALLLLCSNAFAAGLFDGKYSQNQVFDVARSGCGSVGASCYVYNFINPFIAPYTNWTNVTWAAGDYVQFYDTGAGSNNIGMKQYASNGTYKGIISSSGYVQALGDGILYIGVPGTGGGTGYFISNSAGYSYGGSATFTVQTLNPTMTQLNSYSASSTPLASGQTAQPAAPAGPTPTAIYSNSSGVYITSTRATSTNSPAGEGAAGAVDNNSSTKYLNFDTSYGGPGGSGFSVKLNSGRAVTGIKFTTANDFPTRDPSKFSLYGSNDGVTWIKLVDQQAISLPSARYTASSVYSVTNADAYVYYYVIFNSTKYLDAYADYNTCVNANGGFSGWQGTESCHAVQVAEVTLIYDSTSTTTSSDTGSGTVANPGTPGASVAGEWPGSDGITSAQLAQKNSAKNRVAAITLGNSLYIDEKIGSSGNNVTVEQSGSYNKIAGLSGTTYAIIDGDNNTLNIKQGNVSGKNLIEFTVTGNTNNITLWQARSITTGLGNASDSGGHYTGLSITGNSNTLSLKQNNDGGSNSGQFAYIDITGNSNQGTVKQIGNNEKILFGGISGNSNIFDLTQQGTGNHYLGLSLTGNGHNVTVNQKDSGTHNATVNLTNSGGASTVNLVQQSSTGQSINITQQCATLSGCSVNVTQGQ